MLIAQIVTMETADERVQWAGNWLATTLAIGAHVASYPQCDT